MIHIVVYRYPEGDKIKYVWGVKDHPELLWGSVRGELVFETKVEDWNEALHQWERFRRYSMNKRKAA